MRPARQASLFVLGAVLAAAWGCGVSRPGEGPGGIGTVGGGGGTEIFDASGGRGSGGYGASGASGASSGYGGSGAESGASSGRDGSTGVASGSSGTRSGSSGGASTGASGSSGSSGSSGPSGSGEPTDAGDAGDGGTGGIVLTIPPGPVHIVSLSWTISGPNTYGGSVEFGDAQSVEWVVGGIAAAHGYTLSVVATDSAGDPCHGTSSPFNVVPGTSTYTMITIVCDTGSADPADVTTGSVAIEAGVVAASD